MPAPEIPASLNLTAPVTLLAPESVEAAEGKSSSGPRISIVAYTGAICEVGGWRYPLLIDLSGIQIPDRPVPLRFGHDWARGEGVGHADRVRVEEGRLLADGAISRDTDAARDVVSSARNGYPWQASVGLAVDEAEFVREGDNGAANDRVMEGPGYIIRRSRLQEISVVDLGADGATSVAVAAKKAKDPIMPETKVEDTDRPSGGSKTAKQIIAETKREEDRIDGIRALVLQATKMRGVDFTSLESIALKAEEEGWDLQRTELEILRETRPRVQAAQQREDAPAQKVLEAALCLSARIPEKLLLEDRDYGEAVLEKAWAYRNRGLRGILATALQAKGYANLHGASELYQAILESQKVVRASGFSTVDLPGLLGNVANKMLLAAFTTTPSTYEQVADLRDFSNFHQHTMYRLDHLGEFAQVPNTGELQHGKLGESSYTNQLATYGQLLQLSRQQIVNDDLGSFQSLVAQLARKAKIAVEKALYNAVAESSDTFYTSGRANKLTANPLGIDGLGAAEAALMAMADAGGDPIYATPALLIVPPGLKALADTIYTSTTLNETTTANKGRPSDNPYKGRFSVVSSPFLAVATVDGYSPTTWYLAADPRSVPAFQVGFLDGKRQPTIETADAAFDTLGLATRCYFDFGVAQLDYRGVIKNVAT